MEHGNTTMKGKTNTQEADSHSAGTGTGAGGRAGGSAATRDDPASTSAASSARPCWRAMSHAVRPIYGAISIPQRCINNRYTAINKVLIDNNNWVHMLSKVIQLYVKYLMIITMHARYQQPAAAPPPS